MNKIRDSIQELSTNLASTPSLGTPSHDNQSFELWRAISAPDSFGTPHLCPYNARLQTLNLDFARVFSITTYGGPGSKYQQINEDSYFVGLTQKATLLAGVIDGSGGSESGYLGGRIANMNLSSILADGLTLAEAFDQADYEVLNEARGGYATGAAVTVANNLRVNLANKGDTRIVTLRNHQLLPQGVSTMHSHVASAIQLGELPPQAIHTSQEKHLVYSVIGNLNMPLHESRFQGKRGDRIIIASDGVWDVVSDFELQKISLRSSSFDLVRNLYDLAYERNNSHGNFQIAFSPQDLLIMRPLFDAGERRLGDNITVQVIELL